MNRINIASVLIRITIFFVVLTGLNISIFAILSFTNQSDLIIDNAIENVYNAAYILRDKVSEILSEEIISKRVTENISNYSQEIFEESNTEELSAGELQQRREEIEQFVKNEINQEIAITRADLSTLNPQTRIDIQLKIRNYLRRNDDLSVYRTKLFTLGGSGESKRAFTAWGYAQENQLKRQMNVSDVEKLKEEPDTSFLKFVNSNVLEYVNNQLSSTEDRNFLNRMYIMDEENNPKLIEDSTEEEKEKLASIIQELAYNLIIENYTMSDGGLYYIANEDFDRTNKNLIDMFFLLEPVPYNPFDPVFIVQIPEEDAIFVTPKEMQQGFQAVTSSNLGGKLFVNDELVDYKYMDIYIPLGELIIKAGIELPNTNQQFNSLFRVVLIAGGVIITAHLLFILTAYLILVNPMRKANTTLEAQNKKFEEELEVAKNVQEAILPTEEMLASEEKVGIGSVFDSLEAVSGDYLDVMSLGADLVGILVVDVSGHGVASALVTTMAKVSFNSHSINFKTRTDTIFTKVNEDLCEATGDSDYYCTAVMCVINTRTFDVDYSTAGHPKFLIYKIDPPKIIEKDPFEKQLIPAIDNDEDKEFIQNIYVKMKPDDKRSSYILKTPLEEMQDHIKERIKNIIDSAYFIEEYGTRGFMIGAAPFAKYMMDRTTIEKGDKIILFSDGVIEAEGLGDDMYGYERLKKIIIDNKEKDPQEISDLIHQDVIDYRGEVPASDDISIIVLESTAEPEREMAEPVSDVEQEIEEIEESEEIGQKPEKVEESEKEEIISEEETEKAIVEDIKALPIEEKTSIQEAPLEVIKPAEELSERVKKLLELEDIIEELNIEDYFEENIHKIPLIKVVKPKEELENKIRRRREKGEADDTTLEDIIEEVKSEE
jgi:serine phosphatase RsbU (regulator of sigma subunit)